MAEDPIPNLPLRNGKDSKEIQGDILAGFNKDYRMYLFLEFPDTARARAWLKDLTPHISTTAEVATFNERFSAARRALGKDPENLKATWVNVSFTHAGLKMLFEHPDQKLTGLEEAFVEGPVGPLDTATGQRSTDRAVNILHDEGSLSGPESWIIGGIDAKTKQDKQTIHALLNIQSDAPDDLLLRVGEMQALATKHGLLTVFEQPGATLPDAAAGHEHFGFKDGISQPGVLGFDPEGPRNPDDPSDLFGEVDGKLGTTIIAAGEFILGHPAENPGPPHLPPNLAWQRNGSFQVFRRLAQDVPNFWGQITANIHSLPAGDPLNEDSLGAKLVGRWRSGAPIDLAPDEDDPTFDPTQGNNFHFYQRDEQGNIIRDPDGTPNTDNDPGLRCPRFAHIRKVYPRANNFAGNRSRRIIRRGVPFGLPFQPTAGEEHGADAQRGLLFVAYMRSFEDQFEFLQSIWANPPGFPFDVPTPGPDPIIGTARPDDKPVSVPVPSADDDENATVRLNRGKPDAVQETLLHFERWVHTTGAVYTFVPSIPTLTQLASGLL
jgi:Dyp-type peroxidase family